MRMRPSMFCACAAVMLCAAAHAADVKVTGVKAVYRNGQTFVTWKDAAEGEDGAKYRYALHRSLEPITQANLAKAEHCISGILNNSAKLFGSAFNMKDRLDPNKPTCIIEEGGTPLPMWSGLAVHTVDKDAKSYYAVVATDETGKALSEVVPGESATADPLDEKVEPIQPIKQYDSQKRESYVAQTCITGRKNLPLQVSLHASQGQGGGASAWGDYYLYFAPREMGWREGLPGVFSVEERRNPGKDNILVLNSRDAIEHPSGKSATETFWFGYLCVPQWAQHAEPRAYPFTERRTLWIIDWVMNTYAADPERVYAGGQSMGGWGSMSFAFRHPEIFAAVRTTLPRMRQRGLPALVRLDKGQKTLLDDGKTDYYERMDTVKYATDRHDDLPFLIWSIGRHDGFASWKEQVDMVKALTADHHAFAMAWNDGGHGEGAQPMNRLGNYPTDRFALHRSYPAFGNSSINDDLGTGEIVDKELKDGVKEGGVNLGFDWKDLADEPDKWSAKISNAVTKTDMTVDVTPRRCQKFIAKPGDKFKWTNSAGGAGEVAADQWGLVTIEKVKIKPGEAAELVIERVK